MCANPLHQTDKVGPEAPASTLVQNARKRTRTYHHLTECAARLVPRSCTALAEYACHPRHAEPAAPGQQVFVRAPAHRADGPGAAGEDYAELPCALEPSACL